jgi:UDP-2,4-diacetamido-2,4,6-trideoxy-beta-L-altropyranose hydrolase
VEIVFRADASLTIGSGHVMRCLTLAAALRDRQRASVSFLCRDQPGHLCDLIETRGFVVRRLTGAVPASPASWEHDAEETRAAIGSSGRRVDWLVVDHYGLDRRWAGTLRPLANRLMVIDDLADRAHECDLLLDQNVIGGMLARYVGKVPETCTVLLGPTFAMLQPEYEELHGRTPARTGPVRRLFIFMSGGDAPNLAGRVLDVFLSLGRTDVEADVAVVAGSPHSDALRRRAAAHANVRVHCGLPTLAPLMARADLAIGAAGATSWERLCLGLPALVVTMAGHQEPVAAELQRQGLVQWLGHHDQVTDATIRRALGALLEHGLDADWSRRCRAVVDGRGVSRVCDAMMSSARAS